MQAKKEQAISGGKEIPNRWVVSPSVDFVGFVLPVVIALSLMPVTKNLGDKVPLTWHILIVVSVDVAHVYSTIYRTVLDSEATRLNGRLYFIAGPCLFLVTLFVNLFVGTWLGWSLLAYYAMFHFAKQPFGLICIYKARYNERNSFDHSLDYWTCMAAAGIPTLLWHAGEFQSFEAWFGAKDVQLFQLPTILARPLWFLYALIPALWLCRVLQRCLSGKRLNLGKCWLMFAQYFTWYMGLSSDSTCLSLSFINLFHGFASTILVHFVVQERFRQWRKEKPNTMGLRDQMCEFFVSSAWISVALLIVLAMVEEFLWDLLVNQEYLPKFFGKLPELSVTQDAIATSALMMPQLSHYFLDGFIWKMARQNPGLREALTALATNHDSTKQHDS